MTAAALVCCTGSWTGWLGGACSGWMGSGASPSHGGPTTGFVSGRARPAFVRPPPTPVVTDGGKVLGSCREADEVWWGAAGAPAPEADEPEAAGRPDVPPAPCVIGMTSMAVAKPNKQKKTIRFLNRLLLDAERRRAGLFISLTPYWRAFSEPFPS